MVGDRHQTALKKTNPVSGVQHTIFYLIFLNNHIYMISPDEGGGMWDPDCSDL